MALGSTVGCGLALVFVKVFRGGLGEDDQWAFVLRHEKRFQGAISQGTAAEGQGDPFER